MGGQSGASKRRAKKRPEGIISLDGEGYGKY